MDHPAPNYRREFARSPHHLWFGLLTLGIGFLSAQPFFLLMGATAFALGWIYLPDMPFFRSWVDRRAEAARLASSQAQVAEFINRRNELLSALSTVRRTRYRALSDVCRSIEGATAETTDPRLRKLDELMWTFLRLLTIEESLERFLETERREDVPRLVREAEDEVARLSREIESLKAQPNAAVMESRQRLLSSREDRLQVLVKRLQRIEQAKENLTLVVSEQERLEQQIKLIRADAIATKNTDALSARIDATVEHLDQTNKWLAEMDEFKDLVGDLPATESRVGFESPAPPILDANAPLGQSHRVTDRRASQGQI